MCKIAAVELVDRLADRYTTVEIVELLGMTIEDIKEMGLVAYVEDNLERLTTALEQAGVLNEDA